MNYDRLRQSFLKTYRESKPNEQAAVKDALQKGVLLLDELGALAMGALDSVHSTLSDGVEGLIAQLDVEEAPVASKDYPKMYEYVQKNGTGAMKAMLGIVPVEYFTKEKAHILERWYDTLIEAQVKGFDWDSVTDQPDEGKK